MTMRRRNLAALLPAACLAATAGLPRTATAAASDAATVAKNLDAFRQAQISKDAKTLDALTWPELSYSHSDAHIEDKTTFIKNATQNSSKFVSLDYKDPSIRVVGTAAIVRFHWIGESDSADGKHSSTNLAILMTWQKRHGQWKLLDRGSTKL